MALVVFIRGVNVGGHRTFRPTVLARELAHHDVVNVGAAGTFVVRKPGNPAQFRRELLAKLPFEAHVAVCQARDVLRLAADNPFAAQRGPADGVRFVSILSKAARIRPSVPMTLPPRGEWFVRVLGVRGRFVLGVYRRRMQTIGYLRQLDDLFGVPATTRNWNTILAVARILMT